MPTWQTSPLFHDGADINENLLVSDMTSSGLNSSFYTRSVVLGEFIESEAGDIHSDNELTALMSLMMSATRGQKVDYAGDPMGQIFLPIFSSFKDDRIPVAVMGATIQWASYFQGILPSTLKGVYIVLQNTCSGDYTYEINGEDVRPVGRGDLHDAAFDDMKRSSSFESVETIGDGTKSGLPLNKDHCMVSIDVYPSKVFYDEYNTSAPLKITVAVLFIFVFTVCMFVFYDRLVERRQGIIMTKALQSNAIVTSLFPKHVKDRLMKSPGVGENSRGADRSLNRSQRRRLSGYLNGAPEVEDAALGAPIADLFPRCTVLFADIAGKLPVFLEIKSRLKTGIDVPFLTTLMLPSPPILRLHRMVILERSRTRFSASPDGKRSHLEAPPQ